MDYPMTTIPDYEDPWADRLSEYVDGLLDDADTRALEAHLRTCERCRTSVAELRLVVDRLRADPIDEVPEGLWHRIAGRLSTSAVDPSIARRKLGGYSRGVERGTLRKITAAAALTLTFAGGVWSGATLCLAGSAWTPPGWMRVWPRAQHAVPNTARRIVPSYSTDSVLDGWVPLRRSVSDLDEQIADATRSLEEDPDNKMLQRTVQQLTRERNSLRILLDSVAPY